mmetsp:Transcript_72912/g.204786  ORF Transcript_72912/g.204786 Transcript_72912/m.204786 type:complete len:224 (+) Transcript_72912:798-1469(+)
MPAALRRMRSRHRRGSCRQPSTQPLPSLGACRPSFPPGSNGWRATSVSSPKTCSSSFGLARRPASSPPSLSASPRHGSWPRRGDGVCAWTRSRRGSTSRSRAPRRLICALQSLPCTSPSTTQSCGNAPEWRRRLTIKDKSFGLPSSSSGRSRPSARTQRTQWRIWVKASLWPQRKCWQWSPRFRPSRQTWPRREGSASSSSASSARRSNRKASMRRRRSPRGT